MHKHWDYLLASITKILGSTISQSKFHHLAGPLSPSKSPRFLSPLQSRTRPSLQASISLTFKAYLDRNPQLKSVSNGSFQLGFSHRDHEIPCLISIPVAERTTCLHLRRSISPDEFGALATAFHCHRIAQNRGQLDPRFAYTCSAQDRLTTRVYRTWQTMWG